MRWLVEMWIVIACDSIIYTCIYIIISCTCIYICRICSSILYCLPQEVGMGFGMCSCKWEHIWYLAKNDHWSTVRLAMERRGQQLVKEQKERKFAPHEDHSAYLYRLNRFSWPCFFCRRVSLGQPVSFLIFIGQHEYWRSMILKSWYKSWYKILI